MRMLKSNRVLFSLVAVFLGLVWAINNAQPVLAGGATVLHVPVSFLGPPPAQPCTGGTLEAEGNITVVIHPTGQGYFLHIGGGRDGIIMTDVDTGDVYRFVGALNDHTVGSGGGTTVHHMNYISQGPGGNFVGQFLEHVTITPDGEVAVDFEWGNVSCS